MENKNSVRLWQAISAVLLCLLLLVSYLHFFTGNAAPSEPQETQTPEEVTLSLWEDGSVAKKELEDFVATVTVEGSADFIPEDRRIAVFDLDGTLFCETDPVYFDHRLLVRRVLEDPDYKDKASDFEIETANKIVEWSKGGDYPANMDIDHGQCIASSFAGMSIGEFNSYIQEFKEEPAPGYNNMEVGQAFYKPMVEVIEYLKANGFTVYIVSGTDRLIVRGIVEGYLDIPNRQIIGSDETIIASQQGDADGLDYVYTNTDDLILGGQFLVKNLKMNKVSSIVQEIGVQPVLSFGNSTGDSSMAKYVTANNQYRSLAFMLCCDDTVRENGNEEKAQKMVDLCNENGWIPVSMKNDWKTIYGDDVTRK